MHYFILSLSKNKSALYEVRDGAVIPHPVHDMPGNMAEAWQGLERQEKNLQFHSGSGSGGTPVFHGQGGAKDVTEQEEDMYIHMVARSLQTLLGEARLPLVFAGVEEAYGMFRKFDTSGMLLPEYIRGNADDARPEELKERADPLVHAHVMAENAKHLEQYGNLIGTGRTSDDHDAILQAAKSGKVDQLFIEDGTDAADVASHVREHRGRIFTVEKGSIPGGASMAAVLRL